MTASRIEMQFLNANPDVQTISEEPQEYYENYYLAHCPDGITAHSFTKITYKNIYPNIDLVLNCKSTSLEYSFVVYPGGDVKDIKMQWNGIDSLNLLDGDDILSGELLRMWEGSMEYISGLRFDNPLGYLQETGLKFYSGAQGNTIHGSYHFIDKNILGFETDYYDSNQILTIDPNLEWGTYFGGSNTEFGLKIKHDNEGNAFVLENAKSTGLASKGAFKENTGMFESLILVKLNSSGQRLWATYYNGFPLQDDAPVGLAVNSKNEIYIAADTYDTVGVATPGVWQSQLSGSLNAFIAKFDPSGSRIWGTYIGSNREIGLALALDRNENVLLLGWSSGNSNIATSGAYSTKNVSGSDEFIMKLSSSGQRMWGTYCDHINAVNINLDSKGSIYLSGGALNNGFATKGSFQENMKGYNGNGFLAKFNSTGSQRIWSTYFGEDHSAIRGLAIDKYDNIYFCGTVYDPADSSNYVTKDGWHTRISSGGPSPSPFYYNTFIEKFTTDGQRIWGTLAGASTADMPNSIICDAMGNIYLFGQVNGNSYILKPCFSTTYLTCYGLMAKFNSNAKRIWASKFGVNSYTGIFAADLDENNNMYLTGATSSTSGIATTTAFQTKFSGGFGFESGDGFVAKFLYTTSNSDIYGDTNVCNFSKKVYSADSTPCATFHWTVQGGKILSSPYRDSVIIQWSDSVNASVSCVLSGMINDTITKKIHIYKAPAPLPAKSYAICSLDSAEIGFNFNLPNHFIWKIDSAIYTDTTGYLKIRAITDAKYYVTEINKGGCATTDTINIKVNPLPVSNAGGKHSICQGAGIQIGDTANPAYSYSWISSKSGFKSGLSNPFVKPDSTTIYYLTTTFTATGCNKKDSVIITVHPNPKAITGSDTAICLGNSLKIGGKPDSGSRYQWTSSPAGFIDSTAYPMVHPNSKTTYHLTETNSAGCSKDNSITIKINSLPKPRAGIAQVICSGDAVNLGKNPAVSGYQYAWYSDSAKNLPAQAQIMTNPTSTAWYYLTQTDLTTGCSGKDSVLIYVNPLPKPVIHGKDMICGSDSQIFSTTYIPDSRWLWTIKTGKIISGRDSNIISIKPDYGVDTIIVRETNSFGCTATATKNIIVHHNPDARFSVLADSPAYVFKAIDSNEQYYAWDLGDSSTGHFDTITHHYLFAKDSFIHVTFTVANAFGCISTYDSLIRIRYIKPEKFNILVYPNPFINQTRIKIDLDKAAHIQIVVFDAIGRLITTITDTYQPIGQRTYTFDAATYNLAYGAYFLKILVDDKVYVRPVIRVE
jgi:hypothetical protein